jgi:hypothetical protein
LSLLFGVAAFFGTPAASFAIPGTSYSVVWPDKASDKSQAPRQETAEFRTAVPPPATESVPVLPKDDAPAQVALLDHSLFQRPPPEVPSRP